MPSPSGIGTLSPAAVISRWHRFVSVPTLPSPPGINRSHYERCRLFTALVGLTRSPPSPQDIEDRNAQYAGLAHDDLALYAARILFPLAPGLLRQFQER